MSKSAKVVMTVVAILLLGGLAAFPNWHIGTGQAASGKEPAGETGVLSEGGLTLQQAFDALSAYGKTWRADASIASIGSLDVEGDGAGSGQDGYRRGWMAVLIAPDASLWVRFVDGRVQDQATQPRPDGLTPLSSPEVDSPQAVSLARDARSGFTGSENGKSRGFHFGLLRLDEGSQAIVVLGSMGAWQAQIRLDSRTGEVLSSEILTYAPTGGILYSTDSGLSWQASTLTGKMVSAVAADPKREARGYAIAAEKEALTAYQTVDGGRTWGRVGYLPQEAGDWAFNALAVGGPSGSLSLLVGTWTGLWSSPDGRTWSHIEGLPGGPAQWLAAVQADKGQRVLVSISAGDNRGLYSSADMDNWTRLDDRPYRLSQSFDGGAVLATSEETVGKGLLFDLEGEKEVTLPANVLEAAGDLSGQGPVLMRSPSSGLAVTQGIQGAVRWGLSTPLASLAAHPAFRVNPIAIAGGFHTGIYRSADGGGHWEQVLANPSKIVPGSNEVYRVAFLSPSAVIAVNGGALAWQDS